MSENNFDVLIIGGGPSGAACAIKLADQGLNVALLDKAVFPRDKTCGDALSTDVINQLPMLSPKLAESFMSLAEKIPSYGVKIFSPDQNFIDIPFIYNQKKSHGYICKRIHFDNFLFQFVKEHTNIKTFEDHSVQKVMDKGNEIEVITDKGSFTADRVPIHRSLPRSGHAPPRGARCPPVHRR